MPEESWWERILVQGPWCDVDAIIDHIMVQRGLTIPTCAENKRHWRFIPLNRIRMAIQKLRRR